MRCLLGNGCRNINELSTKLHVTKTARLHSIIIHDLGRVEGSSDETSERV